jgi:hypothetical protein
MYNAAKKQQLLVQRDRQDDDDQNYGQDEQQDASLTPRTLLVVTRLLEVDMGTPRRVVCNLHVLFDDIELRSLLMHHMRNIAEQLVELAHALLDIPDLGLALDDHVLLKVDLFLVRQPQLFLLLLLAKVAACSLFARRLRVESRTCRLRRGLFLLECGFLQVLELLEGCSELALELGLCELLRRLGRVSNNTACVYGAVYIRRRLAMW